MTGKKLKNFGPHFRFGPPWLTGDLGYKICLKTHHLPSVSTDGSCEDSLFFYYGSGIPYATITLVQNSRSVVSDSLWPEELQHARLPCLSPTPEVYPNSCPLTRWCHPAISSSVVPFSYCPQSLPASGPFPMSQLFTWGGQSIGVTPLASFLPRTPRTDSL